MSNAISDVTVQASDQARFAASEFTTRFEREMGAPFPTPLQEQIRFAFEMGYLRGRSDGALVASQMIGSLRNEQQGK